MKKNKQMSIKHHIKNNYKIRIKKLIQYLNFIKKLNNLKNNNNNNKRNSV